MDVHLLVISQDKSLRDTCLVVAKQLGLGVSAAETVPGASEALGNGGVDIILADARMAGLNAIELIKTARGTSPDSEVIVFADDANSGLAHHAVRQGANDYLIGPFEINDLKRLLDRLIQKRRISAENRLLREQLEVRQGLGLLIGASTRMQKVYETILKVAAKRHP